MIPSIKLGGVGGAGNSELSFFGSLVAFWEFEENDTGTQFLDSHGANNLNVQTITTATATNTVTGTAVVNRAFFPNGTANRTAFIPRSNTSIDVEDADWTFGVWTRGRPQFGWFGVIFGRRGDDADTYQWLCGYSASTEYIIFSVSSDGSTNAADASGDVTTAASDTEFKFVCCTLDRKNNLIRLRVKGTAGANDNTIATFNEPLYTGASDANFCFNEALGNDVDYLSGDRHLNSFAFYDQAFYCRKAITDAEFDYLYNSGAGLTYAQIKADAGA